MGKHPCISHNHNIYPGRWRVLRNSFVWLWNSIAVYNHHNYCISPGRFSQWVFPYRISPADSKNIHSNHHSRSRYRLFEPCSSRFWKVWLPDAYLLLPVKSRLLLFGWSPWNQNRLVESHCGTSGRRPYVSGYTFLCLPGIRSWIPRSDWMLKPDILLLLWCRCNA